MFEDEKSDVFVRKEVEFLGSLWIINLGLGWCRFSSFLTFSICSYELFSIKKVCSYVFFARCFWLIAIIGV